MTADLAQLPIAAANVAMGCLRLFKESELKTAIPSKLDVVNWRLT